MSMYSILRYNYIDTAKVSCFWLRRNYRYGSETPIPRGWLGQFVFFGFRWDYDGYFKAFLTVNRLGFDFNHDLTWTWPWARKQYSEPWAWMDWSVGGFNNLRAWRRFWHGYYEDMITRMINESSSPQG